MWFSLQSGVVSCRLAYQFATPLSIRLRDQRPGCKRATAVSPIGLPRRCVPVCVQRPDCKRVAVSPITPPDAKQRTAQEQR